MSRLSLASIPANKSRKRRAEDEHETIPRQKRFRPAVGTFRTLRISRTTDDLEDAWRRFIVYNSPVHGSRQSRSSSLPPQSSQVNTYESASAQATHRLDDRQSLQSPVRQQQVRAHGSPDIIGPSGPLSDPFVDSGIEVSRHRISTIVNRPEDVPSTPVFGSSSPPALPQATTGSGKLTRSPCSLATIDEVEMGIASERSVDGHGDNLRCRRTLQERASKVYGSEP